MVKEQIREEADELVEDEGYAPGEKADAARQKRNQHYAELRRRLG
jgi:hypothetical protein